MNFTPHLMPMSRGILETIYVKTRDSSVGAAELKAALNDAYSEEPFVHVLDGCVALIQQASRVRTLRRNFISLTDFAPPPCLTLMQQCGSPDTARARQQPLLHQRLR